MKRDGNGRENLSTISVSVFYYGKQEWERNSRVRERKRDIMVTKMGGTEKSTGMHYYLITTHFV